MKKIFAAAVPVMTAIVLAALSCSKYSLHWPAEKVVPEKIPFRAGPFIQVNCGTHQRDAGQREYIIRWFDPAASANSTVYYGLTADRKTMTTIQESPGGDGRLHEVRLSGLAKGSRYYYVVPGFDDTVHSFQTESRPGGKARMLCMGDTENTASDRETMSFFSEVLARARSVYEKKKDPVLMLHLGDFVKFGSDFRAWESFFSDSKEFLHGVPGMFALGNHEMKGDFGGHYDYFFSHPRYYSFDWGDAHVLVLHPFDGPVVTENGPRVSSGYRQYNFASNDLKKNRDSKWLIVAMHFPLHSTGDFNMNRMLIRQYRSLFKKNRVDVVLGGHDHSFDSFHTDRDEPWGGTWYIVCGTGGSRLDSYIMDRKKNKWKDWSHDRNSSDGLFQKDDFTQENHVYGELSWGFADLEIGADELSITYYRWLSLPDFLGASGQTLDRWEIVPLPPSAIEKYDLGRAVPVKRFAKHRNFR